MGKAAKAAAKAAAKKKGGSSSGLIGGALVAAVAVAAYYGVAQLQQQQATPPPKAELRQPPKTERRQTAANSATADQAVSSEDAALAAAASGRRIAEDQLNMPNHEKPKRVDNGQPPPEPGCGDDDDSCATWASTGECDANPQFMKATCRWSCGLCRGGKPPKPKGCADQNAMCATWASIGECESNPGFMKQQCPVTCRICQSEDCKDTRPDCAERVRGGAESNYSATGCYTDLALRDACAWTCVACGLKRVPRCARKQPATPAARPGSTNAMFERLAARPGATVWSREPWVVTLDDFLTDAEANEVLRSGTLQAPTCGPPRRAITASSEGWLLLPGGAPHPRGATQPRSLPPEAEVLPEGRRHVADLATLEPSGAAAARRGRAGDARWRATACRRPSARQHAMALCPPARRHRAAT